MTTTATAALTGTIRDAATGAPLPDIEIRAAVREPAGGAPAVTRTDVGGAFSLALSWPGEAEGSVTFDACGVAHASREWPRYDVLPERSRVAAGGVLVVDLSLSPGFCLALEVVDEAGSPVEGALVDVIENNTVAQCCTWPVARNWLPEHEREPRSDAEGRVTIRGLKSALPFGDRYFVSLRHPDRAEGLLDRPESLAREGAVARARVVLPVGHVVEGTLRGAGTVGEGKVVAVLEDPLVPGCHSVARTAKVHPDGSFRVTGLREGTHALIVSAPGASPARVLVSVPVAGPVDVALSSGRRVSGSVLGDAGEPLEGASISIEWDAGYRQATTEALGRFAFEGLPAGTRLYVEASSGEAGTPLGFAVLEPSAEEAPLVIDARRRVLWAGRLHDDRTSAPFACSTMVKAQVPGTPIVLRFYTEGRDGRFAARLPPGSYKVGLEAAGELEALGFALLREVVVEEGAGYDLRIPTAAAFPVPVLVLDAATGAPVAGAAVTGIPLHLWGRFYLGNTGSDGVFQIEPAAEAPVHVTAEAEGYVKRQLRDVELRRGMDPVVLRLDQVGREG